MKKAIVKTPETADLASPTDWPGKWPGAKATIYPNKNASPNTAGPLPWVKVEYGDGRVEWMTFPEALSTLRDLTEIDR